MCPNCFLCIIALYIKPLKVSNVLVIFSTKKDSKAHTELQQGKTSTIEHFLTKNTQSISFFLPQVVLQIVGTSGMRGDTFAVFVSTFRPAKDKPF